MLAIVEVDANGVVTFVGKSAEIASAALVGRAECQEAF